MANIRTLYGAYHCEIWYKHQFALVIVILGSAVRFFDYTHKEFISADDIVRIGKRVTVPKNIKTVLMLEAL